MKFVDKGLFAFLFIGLFLTACTKIDPPYAAAKHGHIKDTIIDWDTVTIARKVLLEDYTGHKCVNCPEATITAHSLESLYEGRLYVMAVHAGYYATPSTSGDFTADYRCVTGEEWNNAFGITSNPNGMVNRMDYGGSKIIGQDEWGNAVSEVIDKAPDAAILIFNDLDTISGTLHTTVFSKFINALGGRFNLTVCILEDSLISPQKNNNPNIGPTPTWYDYVFMDVLRGSVNGTWGEMLTPAVDTKITYMGRFSIVPEQKWVMKNCWILAYISNATTQEIIQSEKKKIIPE